MASDPKPSIKRDPMPDPVPDPEAQHDATHLHHDIDTGDDDAQSPPNPATEHGHPIQPAGQATSPASDADAKAHQRTGEPDVDPNDDVDISHTQRVSWALTREIVERIKAHAETNGMTVSDAAADLLKPPAGGGPGFHQNY